MPKVSGIFEKFKDLEQIPIDDISRWLKPQPEYFLENFIANRLLYPQVLPLTIQDLEIELAILKEVVKRDPKHKTHDLQIEFLHRFPPARLKKALEEI